MILSNRIKKVKPSPTLEITAKAKALKAQGVDVISFGSGEPDFDTPNNIKQAAIKALKDGKTKYTPAGGLPELKKTIVSKYKIQNKLNFKISEITVNCGGKHSFYNLMQVLLNKGDEVIIPAPYWVSYPPMVSLADGKPVIIQTSKKNNFKITPADLKKKITRKTRAIVINSPSNPTGVAYSKKELSELVKILRKDILIISDDIYESIKYDNLSLFNCANISQSVKKQTILLNGVSKTYSMTGWRIGYMAGPEDIIKKVETLQSQSTSNPTSIAQWAAIEALSGSQVAVQKMVKAFTARRKLIVDKLNAIKGIECSWPDGSFYVFPEVSKVFKFKKWPKLAKKYKNTKAKSIILSSYLLDEAKVAVVPGFAFGNDNYFRLSFATSDANIIEGIKRIKVALEKLN